MTCENLIEFKAKDNQGTISGSRLERLFKDMTGIYQYETADSGRTIYHVMNSDVGINGQ
jgi:hypothetical protein